MAIRIMRYTTSWRDSKGWVGRVTNFISTDDTIGTFEADTVGTAAALQAAIGGLTNAAFAGDSGLAFITIPTLAYGAASQYTQAWVKAIMTFETDDQTVHRFRIPAPEVDLFDTDQTTVLNDGTQAQVVAYVNLMKGIVNSTFICTKDGAPFTHFVGGILRLGKQPRRFSETIKSSHLVAGEGE